MSLETRCNVNQTKPNQTKPSRSRSSSFFFFVIFFLYICHLGFGQRLWDHEQNSCPRFFVFEIEFSTWSCTVLQRETYGEIFLQGINSTGAISSPLKILAGLNIKRFLVLKKPRLFKDEPLYT